MKANTSRRLLAVIIALLMVFQMVPTALLVSAAEENTVTYVFDATTDVQLEGDDAVTDKVAIPEGTTYAEYFSIVGTVKQRYSDSKGVYAVEIEKNLKGAIAFTVTGTADVTINVSSTGGSNTSAVALVDADGNAVANNEAITEVTGTSATTLTYTDLPAGTYQFVSPESDYGRGYRVMNITVVETLGGTEEGGGETAEPVTYTYTFDAAQDVALGSADKEAITEGTTYADGYFTVVGTVTQRTDSDVTKVKSIELAKKSGGGIAFTVTGTATVTIGASSTGGSNTSIIALVDSEGNEIGRNEVTGTAFVDVTYADLAAGTYQIVCPDTERNTRVETITVVETLGGTEEGGGETAEPVTFWDFRLDEYTGQAEYNGLKLAGSFNKHGTTYGVQIKNATIEVPVSGACEIRVAVGYNWDVTFPDGTAYFDNTNSGDIELVYQHTGEAGTVTITIGGQCTSYIKYIELKEIVEPATFWDFRLDEYTGQAEYNGLKLAGSFNKHGTTYGVQIKNATIEVPVSGACEIRVAVGYNWDVTFPDGTVYFDNTNSGDIELVYQHTGEAGTVTITIGGQCTSYIKYIEVKQIVEPATYWDFRLDEYTGQKEYNGLTIDATQCNKHGATYGLQISNGTVYVPVPGTCQIQVSVGYNWDITFPDGTQYADKTDSGDIVVTYNYTGEAGTVPIVVGSEFTSYIKFIQVDPKDISEVPELEPGKIYVWDFGAAVLEGEQYVNMLTVDEINSWFDAEPGTTGVNIASFTTSDGLLRFDDGGYPTSHRLRTKNAALTRWDDKSMTDADGNEYTGYIYSNKSQDATVYIAIKVNAGEKVTLVVGSNGGNSLINFESPSGKIVTGEFLSSGAKAQVLTFYPTESGEYRIYSTTEKLVVARITREATSDVTVTGKVEAPEGLAGYSVVFTNTLSGAVYTAEVKDGAYSVTLKDGYTYALTLANANGYVITSASTFTIEAGQTDPVLDLTVEQVPLVTVTGTLAGLSEQTLAKLTLEFKADTLYIPEITISGNTYTAILEKGVSYELVVSGINDYAIVSDEVVCYTEDTNADIVFQAKPTYVITIAPEGATLEDLANATFTFTNLNEEGYVYTFTGTDNIELRDGVYAVKVTNSGKFVQLLTSNLTVKGADTTKTIRFTDDITEWDFSDEDFTGTGGSFNGLLFSNGQKNKTYLLANTGTISVPVNGPCKIVVSACYQYSFYFTSEDEASVDQKTGSTSQIDSFEFVYTGEAGFVEITVLGQSYLTKIEIVEVVEFKDTITVGAEGCDYTTINAALNAVKAMDRPNNERVTILIQPGNYEEMLVVDVPNVTLKNASENPSTGLMNEGVDIEENAVRITWYYGHGYTYFSMGNDCKFHADILEVNKENGYASFTNPGAGTTNGSYWNATVVITADGFRAEGIIFENSFNQYISAAAANDVLLAQGSAKEGSVPRAELPFGSTAVQGYEYKERAAALAIANNCSEIYFENCKFIGRQDTLYGGTGTTAAFYDCAIYGSTDYIFGGMTAVFAKCDLVFNTSDHNNDTGYITAAQQSAGRGYLMYNCTITSTTPGVDTASEYTSKPGYFGRPWTANTAEVVFYMTNIEATCNYWYAVGASMIRAEGWLSTLSGESNLVGEYGTYEIALGVDNSGNRVGWANVFETEFLADGTPITIEAFLGDWDAFAGKDLTIVMSTEKVDNSQPEEEEQPTITITKEHSFNAATDVTVAGEETTDKAVIPEGTTYNGGYFTIVGKVTQRWQESKGGVYAVEIAKNGQGAMQFTIKGVADVVFTVASTGGSNTSAVALINVMTGEVIRNVEGLTEVSTTGATTLTYKDLPAGTYQLISPESDYNRGFRLFTIDVTETLEVPAGTGDNMAVIAMVLFLSAAALIVLLPRKKRMF